MWTFFLPTANEVTSKWRVAHASHRQNRTKIRIPDLLRSILLKLLNNHIIHIQHTFICIDNIPIGSNLLFVERSPSYNTPINSIASKHKNCMIWNIEISS